jgi:hypothetical protein
MIIQRALAAIFGIGSAVTIRGPFKLTSDERVFLANCVKIDEGGCEGFLQTQDLRKRGLDCNISPGCSYCTSEMDYYAHDAESRTGQQPDAVSQIDESAPIQWEGNTISGKFQGGDVFVSVIDRDAQNLDDFDFAGSGYNNYHNFSCYKDNQRVLYSVNTGNYGLECVSIYYCEDVSMKS